jgi:hypothetical protein
MSWQIFGSSPTQIFINNGDNDNRVSQQTKPKKSDVVDLVENGVERPIDGLQQKRDGEKKKQPVAAFAPKAKEKIGGDEKAHRDQAFDKFVRHKFKFADSFYSPNQSVKQKNHSQQRERCAIPEQILRDNKFVQKQNEVFQRERGKAQAAPKKQARTALPPASKKQHTANQRRARA